MARTGYVNGSDMLLYIGESTQAKAIGHCTSHRMTFTTETKDRAVKAASSVTGTTAGLWKQKSIVGLSISLSAEGLCYYAETEEGFKEAATSWKAGTAVTVKCMRRGEGGTDAPTAYLEGSFVITSLERTDPANDDSTYSIQLENNGEPTTFNLANLEASL